MSYNRILLITPTPSDTESLTRTVLDEKIREEDGLLQLSAICMIREAVEQFQRHDPEIVVLEFPRKAAPYWEFVTELLKRVPTTQVIIISNTDLSKHDTAQIQTLKRPFQPAYLWTRLDASLKAVRMLKVNQLKARLSEQDTRHQESCSTEQTPAPASTARPITYHAQPARPSSYPKAPKLDLGSVDELKKRHMGEIQTPTINFATASDDEKCSFLTETAPYSRLVPSEIVDSEEHLVETDKPNPTCLDLVLDFDDDSLEFYLDDNEADEIEVNQDLEINFDMPDYNNEADEIELDTFTIEPPQHEEVQQLYAQRLATQYQVFVKTEEEVAPPPQTFSSIFRRNKE